jgi:hypothetical protein
VFLRWFTILPVLHFDHSTCRVNGTEYFEVVTGYFARSCDAASSDTKRVLSSASLYGRSFNGPCFQSGIVVRMLIIIYVVPRTDARSPNELQSHVARLHEALSNITPLRRPISCQEKSRTSTTPSRFWRNGAKRPLMWPVHSLGVVFRVGDLRTAKRKTSGKVQR